MNENDFAKIESMISRQVGAFADTIQHKFDPVLEGQKMAHPSFYRVKE
jgi:hypothetical protein